MAQTKFDKQVEETAEALAFGIGRFLARRAMDGNTRRTDASSSRSGRCVLPEVEGKLSRSSYRAGWQRLIFRISFLSAAGPGDHSPTASASRSTCSRPPPWGKRTSSSQPASA